MSKQLQKLLALTLALAALLTLAAGCNKTVFTPPDVTPPAATDDTDDADGTPDVAPVDTSPAETYTAEVIALRKAIFDGDISALLRLYSLARQGSDTGADSNALQLAAVKFTNEYDVVASIDENPLVRDNGEREGAYDRFPAQRALAVLGAAVRRNDEQSYIDQNMIESNIDVSRRYEPSNYADFYGDYDEMWVGQWELDFDGDGKNELVYFAYGGTDGSGAWEIIHLAENGTIEYVEYGTDMMFFYMLCEDGDYFFARYTSDYQLDYQNGVRMFAMDAAGTLWQADILREYAGLRSTLSDVYDESVRPLYDDVSAAIETCFDTYVQRELPGGFGRQLAPDADTVELFEYIEYGSYADRAYGSFDIDNDGVAETIGEIRYWEYGADRYEYGIYALTDGDDDFTELNAALTPPLADYDNALVLQAFPVTHGGKNYILSLHPFGSAQYIFRLQELSRDASGDYTASVLAAWLMTSDYLTRTTVDTAAVSEW